MWMIVLQKKEIAGLPNAVTGGSRRWPAASAGSLKYRDCLELTVEQCVIRFVHGPIFSVWFNRSRTD
jgi:hypothetical protein